MGECIVCEVRCGIETGASVLVSVGVIVLFPYRHQGEG